MDPNNQKESNWSVPHGYNNNNRIQSKKSTRSDLSYKGTDFVESSVNTDLMHHDGEIMETAYRNFTPDSSSSASDQGTPSMLFIHLIIIAAQVSFGTGSVVGRLGLPSTNPILFALIREGVAGPLLCIIAYIIDKRIPKRTHLRLFLVPGICLYLNQLFFIVGLKLSSSVTGSAWQPSQAIMAAVVGWLLGRDDLNPLKVCGILVGFGGALFMVLYHADFSTKDMKSEFGGNICFFVNCMATALYLILGRPALGKYPSSTVTGYCYIIASLLMVVTALIFANFTPAWKFVCHDCTSPWIVPRAAIWALAYWIVMQSLLSYLFMTWANKWADPSVNLAYTVLQPLTASVVSTLIIAFKLYKKCDRPSEQDCLYGPSLKDLGAIGIAIGLMFVIWSDKQSRQKRRETRGSNLGREPLVRDSDAGDEERGILCGCC